MEQYSKDIEYSAQTHEHHVYHNEGNSHALIIFKNIFKYSDKCIRIAANQLYNDEVVNTSDYISAAKQFLDKPDAQLHIIITTIPSKDSVDLSNSFYGMLLEHPAYSEGRVIIKSGNGNSYKDKDGNMVNFCVADDHAYRIEDDVIKRTAIVDFEDKETAQDLISKFDTVFDALKDTVQLETFSR